MSAHIALTTYVPHFRPVSAAERASDRWNLPADDPAEVARHNRLIAAIRNIPTETVPTTNPPRILEDATYWRRAAWANGLAVDLPCDCQDGMRLVLSCDGSDVEWDVCTRCDRARADLTGPIDPIAF